MTTPAAADIALVAAPAGAKTTALAEVKAFAPVEARVAAPYMVPLAEPEATAETLVHQHDVDLDIPPQEVSSAYVRIPIFLIFSYAFLFRVLNQRCTKC